MFVHHVFFWLKNPESAEDKNQLLQGLRTLKTVEVIWQIHIGVPATTNRSVIERGYHFSLLMLFDSLEEQEVYQDHPTHHQFIHDCSALWEKVIVYDSVEA